MGAFGSAFAARFDPADKPTDKPAMGGGVPTADSATKQAASPLSAAHRQALLAHFSALEHYLGPVGARARTARLLIQARAFTT